MGWQDANNKPLMSEVVRTLPGEGIPSVGGACDFDLDKCLSIALIREHTKTDDVPSVTDNQLRLYRAAAFESAEQYTGALLRGTRPITEYIDEDWSARTMLRGYYVKKTEYPVTDGIVYLYGAVGSANQTLRIQPGTRKLRIPIVQCSPDLSSACCRPGCAPTKAMNTGMRIMYRAGFELCETGDAPATLPNIIILGILKFIAWSVTHPGDVLLTVRLRESSDEGLVRGTNNAAWASGALELWRQWDPDAL